MNLFWSAAQIQGDRNYQEDYFAIVEFDRVFYGGEEYALPPESLPSHWSLFVLADGMGGMGHGDYAAKQVVEYFIKEFLSVVADSGSIEQCLLQSLKVANSRISSLVKQDPSLDGMGATLIAMLVDTQLETLYWLSVGDSLIYRVSPAKQLEVMNEKHTWGNQADKLVVERSRYSEEELLSMQDALCSAVDGTEVKLYDINTSGVKLNLGDVIVVASDGLETLSELEVHRILTKRQPDLSKSLPAEKKTMAISDSLEALIDCVKSSDRAGQDNCTVIVLGAGSVTPDLDPKQQPSSSDRENVVMEPVAKSNPSLHSVKKSKRMEMLLAMLLLLAGVMVAAYFIIN